MSTSPGPILLEYGEPTPLPRPPAFGIASLAVGVLSITFLPAYWLDLWGVLGECTTVLLWPLSSVLGYVLGFQGLAPDRRGRRMARAGCVTSVAGGILFVGWLIWLLKHLPTC